MSALPTASDIASRSTSDWENAFARYFRRPVAENAARPLRDSAEIGIEIDAPGGIPHSFRFTHVGGSNQLEALPARDPQIVFHLTPGAAEQVLSCPSDEIAEIGVLILKLIISGDEQNRIRLNVRTGFLNMMTKGYFGVLTTGGAGVAAYLASRGMGGLDAIKAAFKRK